MMTLILSVVGGLTLLFAGVGHLAIREQARADRSKGGYGG